MSLRTIPIPIVPTLIYNPQEIHFVLVRHTKKDGAILGSIFYQNNTSQSDYVFVCDTMEKSTNCLSIGIHSASIERTSWVINNANSSDNNLCKNWRSKVLLQIKNYMNIYQTEEVCLKCEGKSFLFNEVAHQSYVSLLNNPNNATSFKNVVNDCKLCDDGELPSTRAFYSYLRDSGEKGKKIEVIEFFSNQNINDTAANTSFDSYSSCESYTDNDNNSEPRGFVPNYNGFNAKAAAAEAQVGKQAHSSRNEPLGEIKMTKKGKNGYGACTSSVKWFLDKGLKAAGGQGWHANRCGYGYEMRLFLPQHGFVRIASTSELNTKEKMSEWTQKNAQMGDVCVMTHGSTPNPIKNKYSHSTKTCGHACMFNGEHWVSDFVQNNALVYNSSTYYGVEVYRFKKT